MKLVLVLCLVLFALVYAEENASNTEKEVEEMGRQLVEQGRTFVHHAVKRFAIILPAIFFKLGIAFTLLLLVTVVAVNNGFIGFLILVVGLSSVLAKLQEAKRPPPVPLVYTHHPAPYHHHILSDRSDTVAPAKPTTKSPIYPQFYDYSQDIRYTDAVYGNKKL